MLQIEPRSPVRLVAQLCSESQLAAIALSRTWEARALPCSGSICQTEASHVHLQHQLRLHHLPHQARQETSPGSPLLILSQTLSASGSNTGRRIRHSAHLRMSTSASPSTTCWTCSHTPGTHRCLSLAMVIARHINADADVGMQTGIATGGVSVCSATLAAVLVCTSAIQRATQPLTSWHATSA